MGHADDVVFAFDGMKLAGTLHLPGGPGPHPAVVIVHGSGEVDRLGIEGTLRPVIDHFAGSGFAVLAYDKPGVGASTGHWMRQTFADRARETLAAVRFLTATPGIDATRVGLWGISQGGWIAPMTAALAPAEIAFAILVSAASMTPFQQSMHQLRTELSRDGFPDAQISRAEELMERRGAALAAGVPGAEILAAEPPELAAEPWWPYCATDGEELDYVRPIWRLDVLPFLRALRCPTLAAWGARDVHMPAQRCAAAFAAAFAQGGHQDFRLQIYPNADHRLRNAGAVVPGYLDDLTRWLRSAWESAASSNDPENRWPSKR